jgi:hypothetical protein
MRFGIAALLLAFSSPIAGASEVALVRVWPGWRDAESFERIGEYFGRPEHQGREIILRSRADQRAGYYFLVRVRHSGAAGAVRFELAIIRPERPEPAQYSFDTSLAARESVFQVGLTGNDWPGGADVEPVAWRLTLVDDAGQILAERKSFLWEKPAP